MSQLLRLPLRRWVIPRTSTPGGVTLRALSGLRDEGANRVFVGNIPFAYSEREIADAFTAHGLGEVADVRLAYDWQKDRVKGYGWVQFKSAEAARRALRLGTVDGGEGEVMFLEASSTGPRSA